MIIIIIIIIIWALIYLDSWSRRITNQNGLRYSCVNFEWINRFNELKKKQMTFCPASLSYWIDFKNTLCPYKRFKLWILADQNHLMAFFELCTKAPTTQTNNWSILNRMEIFRMLRCSKTSLSFWFIKKGFDNVQMIM